MPRFEMRESRRQLNSYAGLSLSGQCFEIARAAPWLDGLLPVPAGMKTSGIAKSMVGLLSLSKNDFDAIEPFRKDRFFREALDISKVPSAEWLCQRPDTVGGELREHTGEMSVRLIERAKAPITTHNGFVRLDFEQTNLRKRGNTARETPKTLVRVGSGEREGEKHG